MLGRHGAQKYTTVVQVMKSRGKLETDIDQLVDGPLCGCQSHTQLFHVNARFHFSATTVHTYL
jgi:hypothetical protein